MERRRRTDASPQTARGGAYPRTHTQERFHEPQPIGSPMPILPATRGQNGAMHGSFQIKGWRAATANAKIPTPPPGGLSHAKRRTTSSQGMATATMHGTRVPHTILGNEMRRHGLHASRRRMPSKVPKAPPAGQTAPPAARPPRGQQRHGKPIQVQHHGGNDGDPSPNGAESRAAMANGNNCHILGPATHDEPRRGGGVKR
jgi:hypothetical protein